jgi:hypothetical protein
LFRIVVHPIADIAIPAMNENDSADNRLDRWIIDSAELVGVT